MPTPKLTWGGLVDTYWMYNINPASGANSLVQPSARAFDTNANSLTLALAKMSLNAAMDVVSFQLDLGYGTTGTLINSANTGIPPVPGAAAAPGNIGPSFLIEQAYGEIALPGNLTLDFGKFVTTAGAEVIEANKNWLYSRSFLFNAIPLVHTGVRANLKVNDQLTLQASLVNGWNDDPDNNAWKTGGVSATITVNPMLSVVATTYFGKESSNFAGTGGTPGDLTFLGDLVGALTLSDKFGLNLNFDYISAPPLPVAAAMPNTSDEHILGLSLMGRYIVNDHLYLSARGEWVQTHTPAVSENQEEFTVMAGLPVGKNFELRPEIRGDFAGDPIYANGKKNQFTGTIAALTFF